MEAINTPIKLMVPTRILNELMAPASIPIELLALLDGKFNLRNFVKELAQITIAKSDNSKWVLIKQQSEYELQVIEPLIRVPARESELEIL